MLPKIKKILYATGLGPEAPHVFRYALAMATKHDAQIIAVSALEPLSPFGQSLVELHITHEDSEQRHRQARNETKERLQTRIAKLCEKECGNEPQCSNRVSKILVEDGHPAQVVLTAAERLEVDLIIMGSHRHSAVGDALLGTTTHKVLHSAAQPVLVVRIPEGFHEDGF
ncbi:MAG: universal stress protein [Deltaproteobacteria bacterium]|jgi:nucleotide-binding universal stress UspA family protein|nr:universal stress protein [Deltaproteobacteria bacterium]